MHPIRSKWSENIRLGDKLPEKLVSMATHMVMVICETVTFLAAPPRVVCGIRDMATFCYIGRYLCRFYTHVWGTGDGGGGWNGKMMIEYSNTVKQNY